MPPKASTSSKKNRQSRAPGATRTTAPCTLPSNVHPFYESQFCPIELSDALRSDDGVKTMLLGVQSGALTEWNLGRKGTHISSHFVTHAGYEDTLTSPNPNDNDYPALVQAHIGRLRQLFGMEPDPITA